MAYTSGFTAVTGATYTAAQYNTYTRDNLTAIWVYTTAGDIAYATSATTLARRALVVGGLMYGGASTPSWRALTIGGILYGGATAPEWLAKPSSLTSYLTNTSSGTPAWASKGLLAATGLVAFTPGQTDTTGSFVDVTGATLNLSLPSGNTYTVVALAGASCWVSNTSYSCQVIAVIDGTADTNQIYIGSNLVTGLPIGYYRTGIVDGTRTVKLQFRVYSAGATAHFERGWLIALAFTE